jgi:hypothetical protein
MQAASKWGGLFLTGDNASPEGARRIRPGDAPDARRALRWAGLIICRWVQEHDRLIGPALDGAARGRPGLPVPLLYRLVEDQAFKPLDHDALRRLLIAYIDEARAAGDPLTMLGESYPRQANDR